jgi:hypothetical protein
MNIFINARGSERADSTTHCWDWNGALAQDLILVTLTRLGAAACVARMCKESIGLPFGGRVCPRCCTGLVSPKPVLTETENH